MTSTAIPDTQEEITLSDGSRGRICSLPALARAGFAKVDRLPVSLRIVLESVLRNCDGESITAEHVRALATWDPTGARESEVPFTVSRVILQDFTGVPLLADLAAMRDAAVESFGRQASLIEPLVPVDLVVDHSVQVDRYGTSDALSFNLNREFERNAERYRFLKWGMSAFKSFKVVPPSVGIVHQVNLEHLACGVVEKDGVFFPDTLVGTDSHTTMINGVGVVGWGVGGIEAEAAMLGQPVNFLTPDVIGVCLTGKLREGRTATDLVLTVTEMLRRENVVGKFVEFFGEGAETLSVPDRATISNMAPEYGATIGYFPVDEKTLSYFATTGRSQRTIELMRTYLQNQNLFGMPGKGDIDYTKVLELDLATVEASVAGPKRPQDRIELGRLGQEFSRLLEMPAAEGGFGRSKEQTQARHETGSDGIDIGDGDVLIAAITSCTNTSNPAVLTAAGLLARKAIARGLKVRARVKTSLAPGSRVVTDYLAKSGLLADLEKLGFNVVGYGCTTCIGNSGPIDEAFDKVLTENGTVAASVLSGNRNFEARVHPSIRANFLMSPPLVVAFALAGTVRIDLSRDPIGQGSDGPVYLRDIWPSNEEIAEAGSFAQDPENYRRRYSHYENEVELWNSISAGSGERYEWQEDSTYIRRPPFFSLALSRGKIEGARALAILGDTITTDHISPAGAIKSDSPAGGYLREHAISQLEFNSYGARRGNHEIMMRGTFANVRIKNLMVPGVEGGFTVHQPSGEQLSIYDAAMRYRQEKVPLIVLAGHEYGTGSSRDWAAKGTRLLGVRAVIAASFERIHRSNLLGMGVLPLQFAEDGASAASLGLDGSEIFAIEGIPDEISPKQEAVLVIARPEGQTRKVALTVRIDTATECEYFAAGGILPHVLGIIAKQQ